MISCVLETVKLFQFHGFKVSLVVYDGASSNIAAIKASHNYHGAYSVNEQLEDKYMIEPWMINPSIPCTNCIGSFVHLIKYSWYSVLMSPYS